MSEMMDDFDFKESKKTMDQLHDQYSQLGEQFPDLLKALIPTPDTATIVLGRESLDPHPHPDVS